VNAHSIYSVRRRQPKDGPGGPLATDFLASVVGASSGAEAADIYAELSGIGAVTTRGRVTHEARRPDGRLIVFHSRKETAAA
jgi:hypothetical protein